MSIHEGHRQRVKDRFRREGLDNFEAHQVLEMLLFYCIPRRDTNEIAHNLIERFGSFDRVLDAPVRELEKVEGMGKNAADFLAFVKEVGRYYQVSATKNKTILTKLEEYGEYLSAFFERKTNEAVYLLCLDAKCKVLDCRLVNEGDINSVGVSVRKILDIALATNATSVVMAHNHPGGVAVPSTEDINTTLKVAKALATADVILVDHFVVADNEYISFVQSGLYNLDMVR